MDGLEALRHIRFRPFRTAEDVWDDKTVHVEGLHESAWRLVHETYDDLRSGNARNSHVVIQGRPGLRQNAFPRPIVGRGYGKRRCVCLLHPATGSQFWESLILAYLTRFPTKPQRENAAEALASRVPSACEGDIERQPNTRKQRSKRGSFLYLIHIRKASKVPSACEGDIEQQPNTRKQRSKGGPSVLDPIFGNSREERVSSEMSRSHSSFTPTKISDFKMSDTHIFKAKKSRRKTRKSLDFDRRGLRCGTLFAR